MEIILVQVVYKKYKSLYQYILYNNTIENKNLVLEKCGDFQVQKSRGNENVADEND